MEKGFNVLDFLVERDFYFYAFLEGAGFQRVRESEKRVEYKRTIYDYFLQKEVVVEIVIHCWGGYPEHSDISLLLDICKDNIPIFSGVCPQSKTTAMFLMSLLFPDEQTIKHYNEKMIEREYSKINIDKEKNKI